MRARQARMDQLDHLIDREAMGEHDRLGASVAGHGEQFERPTAIRLGAVATATGLGHGVVAAGGSGRNFQDTTPRPSEGGTPVRYFGLQASHSGIGLSAERSIRSMPRMRSSGRAFSAPVFHTSRKSLLSPMARDVSV